MKTPRITRTGVALALTLVILAALVVTSAAAQSLAPRPAQATAAATAATTAQGAGATAPVAATTAPGAATPAPSSATTAGSSTAFLTMSPTAGFPLDPFVVSLQGGGPQAANKLSKDCTGYIPVAPALSVDYQGKGDVIRVFFYSDGDTTLVIQTPDGKYVCDDDTTPQLLDPTIVANKPAPGRYNIWVGSNSPKDLIAGFLVLTARPEVNLGTFALSNLVKRPVLPAVIPLRDRLAITSQLLDQAKAVAQSAKTLSAGSAPLTTTVNVNGLVPAFELTRMITMTRTITPCAGLVNAVPNFAFNASGSLSAASVFFEGTAPSTLLVRNPDGTFACADYIGGAKSQNPLIVLDKPANGTYLVWVGRTQPVTDTGTLTVAPDATTKPKALK